MAHSTPSNPQQPRNPQDKPVEGPAHPLLRFYEENKRLVLGGSALIIIVVAVVLLVQSTVRAGEEKAWSDLYDAQRGPSLQETTDEVVDQIDRLERELPEMTGTDAEPWVHYYLACQIFKQRGTEEDLQKALEHLETIAREFPDHYLMHASFLGGQEQTVPHMIDMIRDELAWKKDHPIATNNPDPESGERWEIETSKGTVTIELYSKQAPENCAAFRKLASSYAGLVFKTVPSATFLKGGEPAGEENPLAAVIEADLSGFPPLEATGLYHFGGTVSFEAPPPSSQAGSGAFIICLDDSFQMDDSQTVFAKVVSGLSVIEDIADLPKKDNLATELAEPVTIASIHLAGEDAEAAPQSGDDQSTAGGDRKGKGRSGH